MPIIFFVSTVDGSAIRPNTSWEADDTYVEMSQKSGVASNGSIFMYLQRSTPWKINMEPTNHPFRKENDLPNLHDYVPC